MCLYIVDNVSTCRIIYFRYVDTEKRIDNSPNTCVLAHHSFLGECYDHEILVEQLTVYQYYGFVLLQNAMSYKTVH